LEPPATVLLTSFISSHQDLILQITALWRKPFSRYDRPDLNAQPTRVDDVNACAKRRMSNAQAPTSGRTLQKITSGWYICPRLHSMEKLPPYAEEDVAESSNYYGVTKLEEKTDLASGCRFLIVRSSWISGRAIL
jgi:hypothetical protein